MATGRGCIAMTRGQTNCSGAYRKYHVDLHAKKGENSTRAIGIACMHTMEADTLHVARITQYYDGLDKRTTHNREVWSSCAFCLCIHAAGKWNTNIAHQSKSLCAVLDCTLSMLAGWLLLCDASNRNYCSRQHCFDDVWSNKHSCVRVQCFFFSPPLARMSRSYAQNDSSLLQWWTILNYMKHSRKYAKICERENQQTLCCNIFYTIFFSLHFFVFDSGNVHWIFRSVRTNTIPFPLAQYPDWSECSPNESNCKCNILHHNDGIFHVYTSGTVDDIMNSGSPSENNWPQMCVDCTLNSLHNRRPCRQRRWHDARRVTSRTLDFHLAIGRIPSLSCRLFFHCPVFVVVVLFAGPPPQNALCSIVCSSRTHWSHAPSILIQFARAARKCYWTQMA